MTEHIQKKSIKKIFALSIVSVGLLAPYGMGQITTVSRGFQVNPFSSREAGDKSKTKVLFRDGVQVGPAVLHLNYFGRHSWLEGQRLGDTWKHTVSPSILADFGDNWSASYRPSWVYFSNDAYSDTRNDSFGLTGRVSVQDWEVSLRSSYRSALSILAETGSQTDRTTLSNSISTSRQITHSGALRLGVSQSTRKGGGFSETDQVGANIGYNFAISPRTRAGISLNTGKSDNQLGVDRSYWGWSVNVNSQLTQKLSTSVSFGDRISSYDSSAVSNVSRVVWSASLNYQPFDVTSIGVSTNGTFEDSIFNDQTQDRDNYSVTLSQRFLGWLFFSAGYSRVDTDYIGLVGDSSIVLRSDNFERYNIGLSTEIFDRGTLKVFYTDSNNDSSIVGLSRSTSEYGLSYSFWQ